LKGKKGNFNSAEGKPTAPNRERGTIMRNDYQPKDGDFLKPDGWHIGEGIEDDPCHYQDESFPGCQFRIFSYTSGSKLAINLGVTGKDYLLPDWGVRGQPRYKCRVRIEFVGDGEPSVFCGGYLYHD